MTFYRMQDTWWAQRRTVPVRYVAVSAVQPRPTKRVSQLLGLGRTCGERTFTNFRVSDSVLPPQRLSYISYHRDSAVCSSVDWHGENILQLDNLYR